MTSGSVMSAMTRMVLPESCHPDFLMQKNPDQDTLAIWKNAIYNYYSQLRFGKHAE